MSSVKACLRALRYVINIKDNLNLIEKNICAACARSGRGRADVRLIVVSKNQTPEDILRAYDSGSRDFGENRVQEMLKKIPLLPPDINWHLIGHLQRNKVKDVVGKVAMIHGVDSLRLAEEINKAAAKRGITQDILLEVNIAMEETKHGAAPEDVSLLARRAALLPHINIRGLMCIAPYVAKGEENRPYFKRLSQLLVDIAAENIDNTNMADFSNLSMGMTLDYTVAVEEGATMLRIGTAVFTSYMGANERT